MKKIVPALIACTALIAGAFITSNIGFITRAYFARQAAPQRGGLDGIHTPAVNEYRFHYKDEAQFPLFSWIYAGFITDRKGAVYQFSCTYYAGPSSYYAGHMVFLKKLTGGKTGGEVLYKFDWKADEMRFSGTPGSVRFEAGSKKRGFEINVSAARHTLKIWRGAEFALDLAFERMEPAFFYNHGDPIPLPSGDKLMLMDDFMGGKGSLRLGGVRTAVSADVAHERVYSPADQWQFGYEDWLCVFHEDFYALIFITGERDRQGPGYGIRNGFVYFRKDKKYVPLDEMTVSDLKTEEVAVLKRGVSVRMKAPLSLRAEASGGNIRFEFDFERLGGAEERELAMKGRGSIEYNGARTNYDRVLAWEEFMR